MITFSKPNHHWNYFLAIEKDLENLCRYIEFSDANMGTYSIELAHILLSASSEIDVIMKQLCDLIDPEKKTNGIDDYRAVIKAGLSPLIKEKVSISRYSIVLIPWDNWNGEENPQWWRSHNHVKHERNIHFKEANLKNTINAVGALLLTVIYYYKSVFSSEAGHEISIKDTIHKLEPESLMLKMSSGYYYQNLVFG